MCLQIIYDMYKEDLALNNLHQTKLSGLVQHHLSCVLLLLSSLFTPLDFFTSALADGFSLEFEWQQVSPGLQDSSQHFGRSQ